MGLARVECWHAGTMSEELWTRAPAPVQRAKRHLGPHVCAQQQRLVALLLDRKIETAGEVWPRTSRGGSPGQDPYVAPDGSPGPGTASARRTCWWIRLRDGQDRLSSRPPPVSPGSRDRAPRAHRVARANIRSAAIERFKASRLAFSDSCAAPDNATLNRVGSSAASSATWSLLRNARQARPPWEVESRLHGGES